MELALAGRASLQMTLGSFGCLSLCYLSAVPKPLLSKMVCKGSPLVPAEQAIRLAKTNCFSGFAAWEALFYTKTRT